MYYPGTQNQWNQITIGWDNDKLKYASREYESYGPPIPCDFNGDRLVSDADAVYLLRHTLFQEEYPLNGSGDTNGDGEVTDADAVHLLRYTLFPEDYPLFPAGQS